MKLYFDDGSFVRAYAGKQPKMRRVGKYTWDYFQGFINHDPVNLHLETSWGSRSWFEWQNKWYYIPLSSFDPTGPKLRFKFYTRMSV